MPQIPVDLKQALVGFPMDPVIRARHRLLLDLINEALAEVFEHHESFASDEPRRAPQSYIMLTPPHPISKQVTATRVAKKVGAWNAYTEVHAENLDQMLMDSVKADERNWLDINIDRDTVVAQVADGLSGDISKDALSILSCEGGLFWIICFRFFILQLDASGIKASNLHRRKRTRWCSETQVNADSDA
ncbi:hypothetical protein BJ741DRAFT_415956 [Chytriomyces cf. hyalinus JEL632]|nr:hypothetical protein BJ741DRAFT_415956 [Chytriomyces cf. hyalinus JEL632]